MKQFILWDLSTGFTSSESIYAPKEECVNLHKPLTVLSMADMEE